MAINHVKEGDAWLRKDLFHIGLGMAVDEGASCFILNRYFDILDHQMNKMQ